MHYLRLIYNSNLSVVPITTHVPLKKVASLIKKKIILSEDQINQKIEKLELEKNNLEKKLNILNKV